MAHRKRVSSERDDAPEAVTSESPLTGAVPHPLTAAGVMALQRSGGNQLTCALLRSLDRSPARAVQRKPLASGKLNVAGEAHKESDPRRAPERRYAKAKANGDYWQEGEFRPAAGWWDRLSRTTPKLGDPLMLRAAHLVTQLKEKWMAKILVPMSTGTVPPALGIGSDLAASWPAFRDLLKDALAEVKRAVALASHDAAETGEAQSAARFHEMLDTLVKTGLGGDHTTIPAVVQAVRNAIDEFERNVSGAAITEDAIMLQRSRAMHQAAEKAASTGGVWKVGNEHIPQMLAVAKSRSYEILTKDEFNADFTPWTAQNP